MTSIIHTKMSGDCFVPANDEIKKYADVQLVANYEKLAYPTSLRGGISDEAI